MTIQLASLSNPPLDLDWLAAVTYSAVFSDVCDYLNPTQIVARVKKAV